VSIAPAVHSWGGQILLENLTGAPISDWALDFDIGAPCDASNFSGWSATFTRTATGYHVTPPSWGATIAAHGTYTFGFNKWGACANETPTNFRYTGAGVSPPPPAAQPSDCPQLPVADRFNVFLFDDATLSGPARALRANQIHAERSALSGSAPIVARHLAIRKY
jgi:hypothetical protein